MQWQVLTKTPKLQAMSTNSAMTRTLQTSGTLVSNPITTSGFSLKPGTLALDPNAGNDHIVLPEAYKGIARA